MTPGPPAAPSGQTRGWWAATRSSVDGEAPALRHSASVIGVVLALLAILIVGGSVIEYPGWMWLGVILTAVVEIVALVVPWERVDARWVVLMPLTAILALGLFRVGTGGSQSLFAALLVLPLIWVAVDFGRRMVAIASGLVFVVLLLPYFLGTEAWSNGRLIQVLFSATVFTGVAIVVNEMSRNARERLKEVTQLSQDRARLLSDAEQSREELSRAAERLRTAEAFANSIWDALENEAVIVTDLDGRIVAWGPGARILLGYTAGDGRAFSSAEGAPDNVADLVTPNALVTPDDIARGSARVLERLVSVGSSVGLGDGEMRFVTEAGDETPVFLSCSERRGADGERMGFTFVAREASYATEVARVKDEFVGTISHELRTPLSSILGYLELIAEEDERLSDDQRRFIGVAERNAQRLLHLVGDLLFIAQVDGGKVPIEVADTDISAIAAASAESIAPIAATAGVSVSVRVPDSPVRVPGDARRLGQAFDNLVSNAVKFTPAGGSVTISVRREGDAAVFAVADTGMGIEPEELAQLSERFFRTRMATRQAIKGVGLGLSITKAITGAHGGTLSASSVVGEGTTFEIRLPAQG